MIPGTQPYPILNHVPVQATYVGTAFDNTAQTTYTYTSQGIGPAAADRIVVVGAFFRATGTTNDFSSMTIGGNAATLIGKSRYNVSVTTAVALYALGVTSGTTATIAFTLSAATAVRSQIAVWNVNGKFSGIAAKDTQGANALATSTSVTLGVGYDGCFIAFGGAGTLATPTTWTPTTFTRDVDVQQTSIMSGGHQFGPTPNGSIGITATWSGSSETALVAASWSN